MNKLFDWIEYKWALFIMWLDSFEPCPKEELGYTCRHRIMSNGTKECGERQNYWGRGDE